MSTERMTISETGSFSLAEVERVMNRAADAILEAIEAPDEGKRDVANAVVNVTYHFLEHPEATLEEAIEATWQLPASEVLEWCRS